MRPEYTLRTQTTYNDTMLFFHPDYTVGFGISPNQRIMRSRASFTAGGDLHPALKNLYEPTYKIA